ncbi:hypothetical protein O1611_g9666 [Lasiodiplodia mahajangana]|uniref:Uncharacterized protein n=1 Tax=Lasiodiplodia mahajangana TaxID=1108764 RepID=A0ACC2J6U7_9PEZI|nr:hypothetical protein O1611_g9666 [Lasiodiplodia mahajangana]
MDLSLDLQESGSKNSCNDGASSKAAESRHVDCRTSSRGIPTLSESVSPSHEYNHSRYNYGARPKEQDRDGDVKMEDAKAAEESDDKNNTTANWVAEQERFRNAQGGRSHQSPHSSREPYHDKQNGYGAEGYDTESDDDEDDDSYESDSETESETEDEVYSDENEDEWSSDDSSDDDEDDDDF